MIEEFTCCKHISPTLTMSLCHFLKLSKVKYCPKRPPRQITLRGMFLFQICFQRNFSLTSFWERRFLVKGSLRDLLENTLILSEVIQDDYNLQDQKGMSQGKLKGKTCCQSPSHWDSTQAERSKMEVRIHFWLQQH